MTRLASTGSKQVPYPLRAAAPVPRSTVSRSSPADRPQWDALQRALVFRGKFLKQYRRAAPSQQRLLQAFEDAGWPPCIENPFLADGDDEPIARLHNTVCNLNRTLADPVLHFGHQNSGREANWRLTASSKNF